LAGSRRPPGVAAWLFADIAEQHDNEIKRNLITMARSAAQTPLSQNAWLRPRGSSIAGTRAADLFHLARESQAGHDFIALRQPCAS